MIVNSVNNKLDTSKYLCYFALLYLSCLMFLIQYVANSASYSDIVIHIDIAKSISDGKFVAVHNLLHILTAILAKVTTVDLHFVFIAILSVAVLWQFSILHRYFRSNIPALKNESLYIFLPLMIMFASPVYLPFLHGDNMYLGKISNNIWHNPTLIALKPLALLTFFTFLRLLNSPTKIKYQAIFNILLLLSIWTKPNFAIYFMPASFAILITVKEIQWRNKILIAIKIYSLATILLLIQLYLHKKLDNNNNDFILVYGDIWHTYAKSITINIICSLLFVLLVIASNIKMLRKKDVQLSIIGVLIAMLQFYFIAESGDRMYHGNWIWGLQVSSLFVWIVALSEYVKGFANRKRWLNFFLTLVLLVHILTGFFYVYRYIVIGTYY